MDNVWEEDVRRKIESYKGHLDVCCGLDSSFSHNRCAEFVYTTCNESKSGETMYSCFLNKHEEGCSSQALDPLGVLTCCTVLNENGNLLSKSQLKSSTQLSVFVPLKSWRNLYKKSNRKWAVYDM